MEQRLRRSHIMDVMISVWLVSVLALAEALSFSNT
jgi:hypothetical protein